MKINYKPKKGDWIKCVDGLDIRNVLADLGKEGYGAVRSAGNYIIITSVPKEDEQNGEKEKLSQDS